MFALMALVGGVSAEIRAPIQTDVDSMAAETLKHMAGYLAGTRSFSFEVYDMVDEVSERGQKLQFSSIRRMNIMRPNHVAIATDGDSLRERIVFDGERLTIVDYDQNAFGVVDVPGSIDRMLDYASTTLQMTIPLSGFIAGDPYEAMFVEVDSGEYLGIHNVDGVACHHLAFRQVDVDWQVWIDAGLKPVPRKLVVTHKDIPSEPQYIAFFRQWRIPSEYREEDYVPSVPSGAKEVDLQAASPVVEKPIR